MYAGKDFSPSTPLERKHFIFDFAGSTPPDLGPSEYIQSATWTLAVHDDPNLLDTPMVPGHVVTGTDSLYPAVNPTQAISPLIQTLVGGVVYRLQCDIVTTVGQTLEIHSYTRCIAPA